MTAIALMAEKLRQELQARDVEMSLLACIQIIRTVIDHASEVAKQVKDLETSEMGKQR
jgi:hypothetical protein